MSKTATGYGAACTMLPKEKAVTPHKPQEQETEGKNSHPLE